jgi:tRNA(Ile)-lysidine synthase
MPRNGHIIRPLLCVGREEIIKYLEWRKEKYVTDSTNLTADYTRNKIRLEVIPKLAEINPSILGSLAATAQRLNEAELIYSKAIEESISRVKEGNLISIERLRKEVAPATVLHEILSPLGFNGSQAAEIASSLDANSGKLFSSGKWIVVKDRDMLVIAPEGSNEEIEITLPASGSVTATTGTLTIEEKDFDGNIPKERNIACLDVEKLHLPLTLRNTHEGDRFAPFGMHGTKLVSDYLTDRKKSFIEKQAQLVVVDAGGEIVWIVNERPSARCCITEKTRRIVRLEWKRLLSIP